MDLSANFGIEHKRVRTKSLEVELKGDIDKDYCVKRGDGKIGKNGLTRYIKNKRKVVVSEYCPVAMSSLYCLVSLYLKKRSV